MKRSHIDSKYATEVYKEFRDAHPNFVARHLLFPMIGLLHSPKVDVRFANDEAEDRIRSYPANRIGRLLVSNHPHESDAYRLTAGFRKAGLKDILNETITLAKAPLFRHPLQAPLVRAVGAVPVFRAKDEKLPNPIQGSEKLWRANHAHANARTYLNNLCANSIKSGRNVMIFPQGTAESNTEIPARQNPLDAVPFKDGVAYIALRNAFLAKKLDVIPMGLVYENDRTELRFGEPFTPFEIVGSTACTEQNRDQFVLAARQRVEACLSHEF